MNSHDKHIVKPTTTIMYEPTYMGSRRMKKGKQNGQSFLSSKLSWKQLAPNQRIPCCLNNMLKIKESFECQTIDHNNLPKGFKCNLSLQSGLRYSSILWSLDKIIQVSKASTVADWHAWAAKAYVGKYYIAHPIRKPYKNKMISIWYHHAKSCLSWIGRYSYDGECA